MEKESQPFAKSCEEIIKSLNSDIQNGLSKEEAASRQIKFGPNVLKVEKKVFQPLDGVDI